MSDTFSITESDWQGVDDEPTANSENLVKSGGVTIELGKTLLNKVCGVAVWESVELVPNVAYKMEIKTIDNNNAGFTFWSDLYDNGGYRVQTHYLDGREFTNNTGVTKLKQGTYIFTVSEKVKIVRVTESTSHLVISLTSGVRKDIDSLKDSLDEYKVESLLEAGEVYYNDVNHTVSFYDHPS
jgi:hypothetical protein